MANVLSQSEIDQLLSALASGEAQEMEEPQEEPSRVREYNFKTANKFPKDQMRTLNIVFDSFAQLFATYLSGTLRVVCDAEVVSVEEQTFNEFNNSLPSPVALCILGMPPLQSSVMMEISPGIVYAMVSRLFGGSDDRSEEAVKSFTEIELVVLERIVRQTTGLFNEAWAKVIQVESWFDRLETSPQFAQIVALNETIAIVTLSIKIGNVSDIINICIPHVAVEPVSKQLNMRLWYSGGTSGRDVQPMTDQIKQRLTTTPVTMMATFDETTAALRDIIALQIGDVIRLNHRVDEPINIHVEHIPKFKGALGTRGSNYAAQIVGIIKEEGDED